MLSLTIYNSNTYAKFYIVVNMLENSAKLKADYKMTVKSVEDLITIYK
jgi:hypothetical protein